MRRDPSTYDHGRWATPVRPFVNHERRWKAFCRQIEQRIDDLRRDEGIDGPVDPWRAFDPPLPRRPPGPFRPIRLRLVPAPSLDRDARGRFQPRRQAAS